MSPKKPQKNQKTPLYRIRVHDLTQALHEVDQKLPMPEAGRIQAKAHRPERKINPEAEILRQALGRIHENLA